MEKKPVTLVPPTAPLTPPREPLRSAAWIQANVFEGQVSTKWIRKHCPRVDAPGKIWYFESDVRAWLAASRRQGAA
jgi:hypothetical protein